MTCAGGWPTAASTTTRAELNELGQSGGTHLQRWLRPCRTEEEANCSKIIESLRLDAIDGEKAHWLRR